MVGAGHIASTVRQPRKLNVGAYLPLFFSPVQDLSPWNSAGHSQGRSSVTASMVLGTPLQIYPEICLYGDSNPHQVDKISHHRELRGDY